MHRAPLDRASQSFDTNGLDMVCNALQHAKRAFVRILLALAAHFDLRLRITRDSTDKAILTAYRTVCKTVHPDKGGSKDEFQRLQQAKEACL